MSDYELEKHYHPENMEGEYDDALNEMLLAYGCDETVAELLQEYEKSK